MFDYGRLCNLKNLHVFSFGAIIFTTILVLNFFSLSLHYVASESKRNQQILQIHKSLQPLNSTSTGNYQYSYNEGHGFSHESKKRKLTRFTSEFNGRVKEFLSNKCKVQFFMTWISSKKSLVKQREFLSMESLFKSNPNGCLIILSETLDSEVGDMVLKPLRDLGFKVMAISPDVSFLLNDTPAEFWLEDIKSGKKNPGQIPLEQNLSNLIRLAVLYKYGGIYLDTDFIVIKEFSGLTNCIGAQSIDVSGNWTRLNNAVLVFDKEHPLLYKFMEEFASTFNGNRWGYNGPYLVSRVIKRVTKTEELNFTILPPMAFYPVDWTKIAGFFTQPRDLIREKWVGAKLVQLKAGSYGLHLWNRKSSQLIIEEGSIIGRLILEHCVICNPIVWY